ncbi:MAG: PH domain-containing protein [Desulfuromonadales bacterium]|nr:PH domain-containing protein [Desulfuromonadales bacterium]
MRRHLALAAGEEVRWEGRAAPRCYTFRHWRHAIFGIIFLVICSYWQVLGIDMAKEYGSLWLAWLPAPFVFTGLCLAFGHLLYARLEWNHVYYAITDRRLLVKSGLFGRRIESLELSEITYFSLLPQGEQLGTLRVHKGKEKSLTLHCLEYPRRATGLLEEAMGQGPSADEGCALLDAGRGTQGVNFELPDK